MKILVFLYLDYMEEKNLFTLKQGWATFLARGPHSKVEVVCGLSIVITKKKSHDFKSDSVFLISVSKNQKPLKAMSESLIEDNKQLIIFLINYLKSLQAA